MDAPIITRDIRATGRITVELIMADHITAGLTMVDIRDRLRWQSVTALITLAVPDIGRATGITSGSLDIGFIGTGRKSGDAATTLYADIDRATKERRLSSRGGRSAAFARLRRAKGDRPSLNILNDRLNQAPPCQTKTHSRRQAA